MKMPDYQDQIKQHEAEIAKLKTEETRADELWQRVVVPLSHEDRALLLKLLYNSAHGED
jgi:hypothetical protein